VTDRTRLEQERDQALRDLVDLDRQVTRGDIPGELAERLRQQYERRAADALALLETDADPAGPASPAALRGTRARWAAYAVAGAVALFATVVLLPGYLGERPAGGAVTGNEALGSTAPDGGAGTAPRDLSAVTNEEMEAVVTDNPEVIDMRLALAQRYLDGGEYADAARHYLVALDQEPRNVEAQAHYGWLLLQLDEAEQAMEYVDGALAQDPRSVEGLWFKANIAFFGLSDPAAATAVLDQLRQRPDLTPELRNQVETLAREIRARSGE
jgi:tetratricopeptide (TPR) repeat protein